MDGKVTARRGAIRDPSDRTGTLYFERRLSFRRIGTVGRSRGRFGYILWLCLLNRVVDDHIDINNEKRRESKRKVIELDWTIYRERIRKSIPHESFDARHSYFRLHPPSSSFRDQQKQQPFGKEKPYQHPSHPPHRSPFSCSTLYSIVVPSTFPTPERNLNPTHPKFRYQRQ